MLIHRVKKLLKIMYSKKSIMIHNKVLINQKKIRKYYHNKMIFKHLKKYQIKIWSI